MAPEFIWPYGEGTDRWLILHPEGAEGRKPQLESGGKKEEEGEQKKSRKKQNVHEKH